ncbi:hypothetical protein [Alteribacter populi]|uniref:hypothetical protein n=1 Tax=Alteribacter populi TaxID=2011011 RepID=UPI000BBAF473|nr:hypothetical protein [Alteribacter populi]
MTKICWWITQFLLLTACTDEVVEPEMNKVKLDDDVHFPYSIPEIDEHVITAIDVAPQEGDAKRIDVYYTHVENVSNNRQLMEVEEGYEEEFNLRTVYGPYEELPHYGIVLIQSPEPFESNYKQTILVNDQEFYYTQSTSGETSLLAFQAEYRGLWYDVTIFNVKPDLSERQVRREVSNVHDKILEQYEKDG